MPNRDPNEMRQRANKMRELAETFSDPELKRLIRERADRLENEADEMAKSASNG
jgi:hypothetical protein